jgi:hypothetical protein
MSDFSNFRAVYNELTDAVANSKHQFFKDHLENFFDTIDQTPNAARVVSELEARVDFPGWYETCKQSIGSMVGSGELTWPRDKTDKLGVKVAMLRAMSSSELDIYDFCSSFLYTDNNFDTHVYDVSQQIFLPTARELLRYVERRFDNPEVPASDRQVTLDHNSTRYEDADAAMEKLEAAIREANDFLEPEEKEQRQAEVSAARRLMKAVRVRLEPLAALLRPILVQYVSKIKDGLVAHAATATTAALIALFGLIFKSLLGL